MKRAATKTKKKRTTAAWKPVRRWSGSHLCSQEVIGEKKITLEELKVSFVSFLDDQQKVKK